MSQAPDQTNMSVPASIYDMEAFSAEEYDKFLAIPEYVQTQIAQNLYNNLELKRYSKLSILSVGVGTGRLDIPFLKHLVQMNKNIYFVAVEPSDKMRKVFEEKLRKAGFQPSNSKSNEYNQGQLRVKILSQPFSSELCNALLNRHSSFDVILALFVLHTIPNWQDAFLGMFKLLKPGGAIVLAEECGDIQWLDNRLVNMERVSLIWQNMMDDDEEAKHRWFHYKFWQEYHRLRRDMLGKGWDPEISATDLGPIKATLSELARLRYGKWNPLESIEWDGEPITIDTLLDWIEGKQVLFTPLLLWGLTKQDLTELKRWMEEWIKRQLQLRAVNISIPRKEGHKFYIYQKPDPEPDEFQKMLGYLLQRSRLAIPRLVERIDYNKIDIDREEKTIYHHACNRLSLLYQQHFRGQEPIALAYISWDLVRGKWRTPLPILVAGIPGDKIIEFVASYALYPWLQSAEQESLSLNQLMLREMPEMFIFRVKRVNPSGRSHVEVKVASYRKSGRPISVEIKVPMDLGYGINKNLEALKNELANALAFKISCKLPVVGTVAIINYEDFQKEAESKAVAYPDLAKSLGIAFKPIEQTLEGELEKLFKFFRDAYAWTVEAKFAKQLARLLPRVFLIGATTEYWLHEIQWIPGKGISKDNREQAFGGTIILKLAGQAGDDKAEEELLDELTLVQTLEGSLDGIREHSHAVRYQVLSGGTRAAVTALGARNLSHHSGSHILHWLEQEARELADEFEQMGRKTKNHKLRRHYQLLTQHFKSKALFYAYLRERMDLVAGMAVYLPTWTATTSLDDLIAGLKPSRREDSIVLRHIGQSEGVYCVDVVTRSEDGQKELAIPGSVMGKQAFYGLLENIIRDAAKYGDIQSDAVVIITKIKSNGQWRQLSPNDTSFKCYHLDSDTMGNLGQIIPKDSNRCLVLLIREDSQECYASRQLGEEKSLSDKFGNKFIVWKVNIFQDCQHRLCEVIHELLEQLKNNNEADVCEKAKELDRALLSVRIECSDLEDDDFQIEDEEWKGLDERQRQQRVQEAKENLYRIVIYDDRSSFSQNEKSISEVLNGLEEIGLCDESGRLRPGDWGIKERYIFAAYLKGEKPEDWLLPKNMRAQRSAIPPILRVKDCSGKLGWVFYMLRPKDILIVSDTYSQEAVPHEKRERINVWSWDTFRQRINSSLVRHKFVILCPNKQDQATQIDELLDYLPYRVFICNEKNLALPNGIARHCALLGHLDLQNLDLWSLYQQWVNFVAQHFGNKVPEVLSVTRGNGYAGDNILNTKNWINKKGANCIALFDRHGVYAKQAKTGTRFFHYEPFGGGWPVERRANFAASNSWYTNSKLWNERKSLGLNDSDVMRIMYHRLKLPLQEAALIRILVVDERIDGSLDRVREHFGNVEFTHRELWELKGVDVMGQQYRGRAEEIPDEKPIVERVKKAKQSGRPYGFVLLHQGILDKLYERLPDDQKSSKTKQEYLKQFIQRIQSEGAVWHILIHSGRGGVPGLPQGVKFIHLSSLEAWFGSNLSKADVVDELMGLRRQDQ